MDFYYRKNHETMQRRLVGEYGIVTRRSRAAAQTGLSALCDTEYFVDVFSCA